MFKLRLCVINNVIIYQVTQKGNRQAELTDDKHKQEDPERLTDHGGASGQCGLGALVEVIGGCHASIRHLETRVHIDAARHQHAAVGVDGFDPAGHDEVFPNLSEEENVKPLKLYHRQISFPHFFFCFLPFVY